MNQEKIEAYKKRLEMEKGELEEKIKAHQKPTNFGDDVDSYDEEKNEAEQFSNDLAIAQTFITRVNEIQDALDRIENKTFGMCAMCGKEIEEEVLEKDPAQTQCTDCKK